MFVMVSQTVLMAKTKAIVPRLRVAATNSDAAAMEFVWTGANIVMAWWIASMAATKMIAKNRHGLRGMPICEPIIFLFLLHFHLTDLRFSHSKYSNKTEDLPICRAGYFLCDNICLPQSKLCDGKVDCYQTDDEANCTSKFSPLLILVY